MEQQELERIVRATLKELGVATGVSVVADHEPGHWRVAIERTHHQLKIKCGPGSTAQWVRAQVFEQYLAG